MKHGPIREGRKSQLMTKELSTSHNLQRSPDFLSFTPRVNHGWPARPSSLRDGWKLASRIIWRGAKGSPPNAAVRAPSGVHRVDFRNQAPIIYRDGSIDRSSSLCILYVRSKSSLHNHARHALRSLNTNKLILGTP